MRDYISDYAVGPYGWIYGSAFPVSFVGSVALATAPWLTEAGRRHLDAVGAFWSETRKSGRAGSRKLDCDCEWSMRN